MATTKTAAARMSEEKLTRAKARAAALGQSMSDYINSLIDRDLLGGEGGGAGVDAAELRVLLDKFGKLVHGTRSTVNNMATLRLQMLAGEIDPDTFDWRTWAKKHLG